MTTLKNFIKLGWYTVPLKGTLERNYDGTKTTPIYEKNWLQKYSTIKNEEDSKIGAVITGEKSGVIILDCDNRNTYDIFKSLDSDNDFYYDSVGKEGGTIVYKYDEDFPSCFKINQNGIKLDFFSNQGACYLPTTCNKTKRPLKSIPAIQPIPDRVRSILATFNPINQSKNKVFVSTYKFHLEPLLKSYVKNKGYFIEYLFSIITPKSYRNYIEYKDKGFLNPNNIKQGTRSDYLVKVSAILGADESVNHDLYVDSMLLINQALEVPLDATELEKNIVNPMLSGSSKVDGKKIWCYNTHWDVGRCVIPTKDYSSIEIVYDDELRMHYTVDLAGKKVQAFKTPTDLRTHVLAVTGDKRPSTDMVARASLVQAVKKPNLDFGFIGDDIREIRQLNLYRATEPLRIFYRPHLYEDRYQKPTLILKYLETLIPDKIMCDYFIRFLKTKLKTLSYSPVILFFVGVGGSGKSLLVDLLREIVGDIPNPSSKIFLDKYNSWLLESLFLELDEFSDTLSKHEKKQALGMIKSISGKETASIREMQTDAKTGKHQITMIMTSNKNPLMLEADDRRIAFFKTPTRLQDEEWVIEIGNTTKFRAEVLSGLKDFCYYLATEVEDLEPEHYTFPPEIPDKFKLIADNLNPTDRIVYAFKKRQIGYLIDLCGKDNYNIPSIVDSFKSDEITIQEVELLHEEMSDGYSSQGKLIRALRELDNITMTTINNILTITNFN